MSKVIEAGTEIARSPLEVFEYVSDATRLPEWQPSVDEAVADPPGVLRVGMTGREVRRVPGGNRTFRWEVTECDPGSRWSLRGVDGPVRAHVTVTLAPTLGGASTHVDYAIWFDGHGIGKLVRLLAQQGARKEVPAILALLKQRLELAGAHTPE
jgi:uncharacterized protein YndB with AHSA1/START domain